MMFEVRCACGQVKGTLAPARAYARASCYCKDCQAYGRFLARPGMLDTQGGTDVVATAPSALRITRGAEHVACMSLSGTGTLRWYADCCRTPLANTSRDARTPYLGVVTEVIDAAPEAIAATFGAARRIVINADSATGRVPSTPVRLAVGGVSIAIGMLRARLRRERNDVFFDADSQPIAVPQVLGPEQRAAVGLPPA